jgi:hypothetical protein
LAIFCGLPCVLVFLQPATGGVGRAVGSMGHRMTGGTCRCLRQLVVLETAGGACLTLTGFSRLLCFLCCGVTGLLLI